MMRGAVDAASHRAEMQDGNLVIRERYQLTRPSCARGTDEQRTMARMRTTAILALFVVGCGTPTVGTAPEPLAQSVAASPEATPAEPTPSEPAPAEPTPPAVLPAPTVLRWELLARPARLTMRDRGTFRLRRQVTNDGSVVADAMRASASFTVNGQASIELDMAFGNGGRASRWAALPPGESAFDEREMGMSLFSAPGNYDLAMTVDGATSTVRVRVDR